MSIEFLDPTSKPANPSSWAIRDRTSLNGAKIGIIWNGRPNGDQLMEQITRRITDRFGATVELIRKKPLIGNVAPAEIVDEFASRPVDYVLAGVGD